MKHEAFLVQDNLVPLLRQTARRTIARALVVAASGIVAVATGVAVVTGYFALGLTAINAAILAGALLCSAGALTGIAIAFLSHRMGTAAARPVETLLAHLNAADETTPQALNFQRGNALTQAAIDADLLALDRRMRSLARRSRLTIADLETAREQSNQQNLAKSKFLANMSHELRTPLNAILGYAMLLQEDASDMGNASAVSDLERIQHAGRNLLSLINDILDLSRIEAGKTVIEREVIDVTTLAQTIVTESCTALNCNGNSFDLHVSANAGLIIGDMGKIRQCVQNMLNNAFKFTEKGQVSLTIERSSGDGLPTIAFIVRDTGIGIDAAHMEELFQAFEQADGSHVRRFGGSGLGLAITRRLARMMGGDCVVNSVKGEGSTFRLILPQSPLSSLQPAAIVTEAVQPLDTQAAGPSVLVIDDNADALDLMRRWLGQMGLRIMTASDGESGQRLATRHKPDVILLDALMPGQSGYDLLTDLRGDPATADIPVVLITIDDDRRRGLAAGASDYLRKPISKEELRSVIEVYCGKASGEILVIEDDDDAADLIRRSVEEVGFLTRRATNGIEGMDMAHKARPSAIVLDLAMPELDGFGVLERLSANAALCDVPLIVLSGQEISLAEHRHLVSKGHRFFTKAASTPRQIAQSLKEMVA